MRIIAVTMVALAVMTGGLGVASAQAPPPSQPQPAPHPAQATGFSFTKIADEFRSAKTWEPVVEDHGADLGRLIRDTKQLPAALEAADKPREAPARDTATDQPQPRRRGILPNIFGH